MLLAQIGRDARGALRPRDPQTARGRDRARQRVEAAFELRASRREEQHDVVLPARLSAQSHTVGHRIERAFEAFRRAHERETCPRLDTELLGKGRPRVPRHEVQSIAVEPWGQSGRIADAPTRELWHRHRDHADAREAQQSPRHDRHLGREDRRDRHRLRSRRDAVRRRRRRCSTPRSARAVRRERSVCCIVVRNTAEITSAPPAIARNSQREPEVGLPPARTR